jgi:hypothetical protein
MKTLRTLILPVAAGLLFVAGCGDYNPDLPDPITAQGYVNDGWVAYGNGNYSLALENFQAAIEADVTYPGGYLGAGWATINLSDYWSIADNYFYMALQLSAGNAPLVMLTEQQVQDTMWTVFDCVDSDLPDSVLLPILALTADSGEIWVGDQIYPIVHADGVNDIPYRFHALAANPVSALWLVNGFSQMNCPVDSIVEDGSGGYWVYVTARYKRVAVGDDDFRTWISVNNVITYDYETFTPGGLTQDSWDALAGWALLQHVRGENGDPLLANAAIWALDRETDAYDFGAGAPAPQDGAVDLSMVQLKGMAAATAFADEAYRFAWFDCTSEGYGLDIQPRYPDFEFNLMQVIESMLVSE